MVFPTREAFLCLIAGVSRGFGEVAVTECLLVLARLGTRCCDDIADRCNQDIWFLGSNVMRAVLDDDLLSSSRQSCQLCLNFMNPHLLIRCCLPV